MRNIGQLKRVNALYDHLLYFLRVTLPSFAEFRRHGHTVEEIMDKQRELSKKAKENVYEPMNELEAEIYRIRTQIQHNTAAGFDEKGPGGKNDVLKRIVQIKALYSKLLNRIIEEKQALGYAMSTAGMSTTGMSATVKPRHHMGR
jgi:hypothetical protein